MNFVKRKATTAKSEHAPEDVGVVEMEEIPPELILNWDQTGMNLVPVSSWTMNQSGAKRVKVKGVSDKRQITDLISMSILWYTYG